ncbi:MAG: MATE family efflux transporter [Acidaminobacteraceae bacterium]
MFKRLTAQKALVLSILTMALPAIIEMALNTLLGVSDTIMISRLINQSALAASGFANSIMFTLIFVFTSFNTGATALVSRSYGEKNFEKLNRIGSQTVMLNGLIGLVVMLLSLKFSSQIFTIFDTTKEVSIMINSYFSLISYGLFAMFLSLSFAAILRGAGDTITPMVVTGFANILNIIGNYVLIRGVWIFPEMGIQGAALSTTLSRIVAVIIYIYICFFKHKQIKIKFKFMKFQSHVLKPLIRISLPGALEQGLMQISFLVLGVFISKLETASEAAFRILINIESISFMPAVGISIAAATLVGKSLGEENKEYAKDIARVSFSLAIVWGIFVGSLFFIFKIPILKIFTTEQAVIETSLASMTLMAVNQPLLNFMIAISGGLRGAGDTKFVMYITLLRLWLVFVPVSYLFINIYSYGVSGLWIAEILSFLIFDFIIFKRFQSGKWADIKI